MCHKQPCHTGWSADGRSDSGSFLQVLNTHCHSGLWGQEGTPRAGLALTCNIDASLVEETMTQDSQMTTGKGHAKPEEPFQVTGTAEQQGLLEWTLEAIMAQGPVPTL